MSRFLTLIVARQPDDNPEQKMLRLIELAEMATFSSPQFSKQDKKDYNEIRAFFLRDQDYRDAVPEIIAESASLSGLHLSAGSRSDSDARRHDLDKALGPLKFRVFHSGAGNEGQGSFDSSAWTGALSRRQRLAQIGGMLPFAMDAVEQLIAELEKPGDNGGPILDHKADALDHLRKLHGLLGSLLSAIDEGTILDDFGQGLPAEAVRYAVRAAEALKDDPLPYSVSAMLLAIFSMLGFGEAGAWVSAVAISFTKPPRD